MPRAFFTLPLLAAVLCSGAKADTTIRYISVDGSDEVLGIQRMHVSSTQMAITAEGSDITTVFDAEKGQLFTVDRDNETVMEIEPEALADKAEQHIQTRVKVLEGMEARLAQIPKEEREKLQTVMDEIHEVNRKATEEPLETQYVGRPEIAKIGDFDAKVIDAFRGERLTGTYFLVDKSKLGIGDEEFAVIEAFQFFLHLLSEKMPAGMRKGLGDYDLLVSDEGEIPVEKHKFDAAGARESREILNGVNHEAIGETIFELPAEFERVSP